MTFLRFRPCCQPRTYYSWPRWETRAANFCNHSFILPTAWVSGRSLICTVVKSFWTQRKALLRSISSELREPSNSIRQFVSWSNSNFLIFRTSQWSDGMRWIHDPDCWASLRPYLLWPPRRSVWREGDEMKFMKFSRSLSIVFTLLICSWQVFECVIEWIRYDLDDRKDSLAELMAHVRLPLVSKDYLVQRVDDEPLIKESVGCKDFLIEAFKYHLVRDAQKKAFKWVRKLLLPRSGDQRVMTSLPCLASCVLAGRCVHARGNRSVLRR